MLPNLGVEAQAANSKSPNFLIELNEEQATVVDRVQSSLVEVWNGRESSRTQHASRTGSSSRDDSRSAGFGAGVIWTPGADGIIVTNAHVIHRQSLHIAFRDGREQEARLVAYDQANDIAALATDATNREAIELGESEMLHPGQLVFALGHPWGVPRTVTAGVVIGAGARLPESPRANREWVAVSLRLRPGNSGGPLVDARGRLLGINTMMTGPDFGMAVPTHVIKRFMRETLGTGSYL